MRLLNVNDFTVKDFNDNNRPSYAILSHTWGDGEVSFQDIQTPDLAASMAGYAKILKCCDVAKQDGFEYVWIDTCCIDKTSSAELSEAINSMFKWYSLATVCYVFLSDVVEEENHQKRKSQFRGSRWFTRGWTLQELLSPEILIFFNSNWVDIGTKYNLRDTISEITNIPVEALLRADYVRNSSVAERMSWASDRETTRVEDIAYSLMGIFNVNMPPLYGEGTKAFQRLQLEIMRSSKDESILAWNLPGSTLLSDTDFMDPLAHSPFYFKYCRGIIHQDRPQSTPPFSMTNHGLHIWLPGIRVRYPKGRIMLYAALNCVHLQNRERIYVGFCLREDSTEWTRASWEIYDAEYIDSELIPKFLPKETVDIPIELYVRQQFDTATSSFLETESLSDTTFHFNQNKSPETGYCIQYFSILKDIYGTIEEHFESPTPQDTITCNCHSANESFGGSDNVTAAYFVIKSLRDPAVRTVVALGTSSRYRGTGYHCNVFPGSDIPSTLESLVQLLKSNQPNNFSEVFPEDRTLIRPGDKIVKHLSNNNTITITIRVGPPIATRRRSLSKIYVHIAFSRLSSVIGK